MAELEASDPGNAGFTKLRTDLEEVIRLTKGLVRRELVTVNYRTCTCCATVLYCGIDISSVMGHRAAAMSPVRVFDVPVCVGGVASVNKVDLLIKALD